MWSLCSVTPELITSEGLIPLKGWCLNSPNVNGCTGATGECQVFGFVEAPQFIDCKGYTGSIPTFTISSSVHFVVSPGDKSDLINFVQCLQIAYPGQPFGSYNGNTIDSKNVYVQQHPDGFVQNCVQFIITDVPLVECSNILLGWGRRLPKDQRSITDDLNVCILNATVCIVQTGCIPQITDCICTYSQGAFGEGNNDQFWFDSKQVICPGFVDNADIFNKSIRQILITDGTSSVEFTDVYAIIAVMGPSAVGVMPSCIPAGLPTNPTPNQFTSGGTFATQLIAAYLNVAFSAFRVATCCDTPGAVSLGELIVVCTTYDMAGAGKLSGLTVSEALQEIAKVAFCPSTANFDMLTDFLNKVNLSFHINEGCTPQHPECFATAATVV